MHHSLERAFVCGICQKSRVVTMSVTGGSRTRGTVFHGVSTVQPRVVSLVRTQSSPYVGGRARCFGPGLGSGVSRQGPSVLQLTPVDRVGQEPPPLSTGVFVAPGRRRLRDCTLSAVEEGGAVLSEGHLGVEVGASDVPQ